MSVTIGPNNITFNNGSVQSVPSGFIKYSSCSGTTTNQGIQAGGWDFVSGTELNMGTPTKSTNWYRVSYYSCADDWGGSNGGVGMALWRYTPSSGWNRILDQGWHSHYDNNCGDFYTSTHGIWYVPVNGLQQHSFRLYCRRHPDVAMRINSSIGADLRRNGWNNNMFEIYEIDGDLINTGNLSRY
jgi:hypothetical protein